MSTFFLQSRTKTKPLPCVQSRFCTETELTGWNAFSVVLVRESLLWRMRNPIVCISKLESCSNKQQCYISSVNPLNKGSQNCKSWSKSRRLTSHWGTLGEERDTLFVFTLRSALNSMNEALWGRQSTESTDSNANSTQIHLHRHKRNTVELMFLLPNQIDT